MPSFRLPVIFACCAVLPSCGLIKAPFRVAGAVVEGTAAVGKSTYNASKKAFGKSEEEQQEEAKQRREKQQKNAQEERAKRAAEVSRHAEAQRAAQETVPAPGGTDPSEAYPPPLPGTAEPLPDDAPLPYQGQ